MLGLNSAADRRHLLARWTAALLSGLCNCSVLALSMWIPALIHHLSETILFHVSLKHYYILIKEGQG